MVIVVLYKQTRICDIAIKRPLFCLCCKIPLNFLVITFFSFGFSSLRMPLELFLLVRPQSLLPSIKIVLCPNKIVLQ